MDIVKPIIDHLLYPLMEARRGNRIREYLAELQSSENAPPHELAELQNSCLRRLLRHCVEQVPAYHEQRSLLPLIESDPRAALAEFPILSKERFRADPESFIAANADRTRLIANTSGGSSGNPLQFYLDRATVEHYEAARWRGLSWYGISPGSRCLMIWGNPFELNRLAERRFRISERWLKNRRIIPAYDLDPRAIKAHLRLMRRYAPEYLYGYAGALTLLARLMLEQGLACPVPLKAVVSTSETLYAAQRELIERAFVAPVVNEYGARDGGIIAYQCAAGGLHLAAENLVAEVIDLGDRQLLPPGQKGLLLLTDLHNFVQPRLRYQIDDEVILAEAPCTCGRSLPLIADILGREDDIFLTVTGRFVHGVAFANCIKRLPEVEAFQIRQRAPEHAHLLLVAKDGLQPPGLAGVLRDFQTLLPGSDITWELVKQIPWSNSGKLRYTVREFPLP
ncbi:MAG: phenylacetate--CoA ligase family protein [Clostridia bacterium]|nr:phenylacetate--CoA ligase family protein [Clostridia bacterium]